jgi:hypothetical protein
MSALSLSLTKFLTSLSSLWIFCSILWISVYRDFISASSFTQITLNGKHCSVFWKFYRNSGPRFLICLYFWADTNILLSTCCWELIKSVGNSCSLSLLFMVKVTVWHFVSNSHKVRTALIAMLTSK